jgi:hypothetical protein
VNGSLSTGVAVTLLFVARLANVAASVILKTWLLAIASPQPAKGKPFGLKDLPDVEFRSEGRSLVVCKITQDLYHADR